MRALRLPLLLLALLAGPALPAAAPAAETGLNINGGAGATNDPAFAGLQHGWNRYFVHWYDLELERGHFASQVAARYRELALTDGRRSLFVLTGTPSWANGGAGRYAPPTNPEDFGAFARRFAQALGSAGDAYEIWNEPDGEAYWSAADRDDPSRYVGLLRSAYANIKAVAPAATVVFGPTTGNNYAYLDAAYKAGAKGFFDAMAVHTDTACLVNGPSSYSRENGEIARFTFLGYRTVRKVMLAHGDPKPIWMTELGWTNPPDIGPSSCARGAWAGQKAQGVSQELQAQYLREAYHCLKEDPYVQVALWFNSKDLTSDWSELNNYGLIRSDGTKRLAFDAFADVAAGNDRVTGPCGDFEAPDVRILEPRPGTVIGKDDLLRVRATSSDRTVVRMSVVSGGDAIYHWGNRPAPGAAVPPPIDFLGGAPAGCRGGCAMTWGGVRRLPLGRTTVKVIATDPSGNVGEASVDVTRIDPARLRPRKVAFRAFRLRGRGTRRVVTGRVANDLNFKLPGYLKVEWQRLRRGGWRKVHGAATRAMAPFRFSQRLRSPGRWRMRVVYRGVRPFRATTSCWVQFTTSSRRTSQVCGGGLVQFRRR